MPYKVIVENSSVTVPKDMTRILNLQGDVVTVQRKSINYLPGFKIPDEDVSEFVRDLIADGDERWNSLLEYVEEESGPAALEEPQAGYDEAPLEQILDDLRILSSQEVATIQEYERANQGRSEILEFNLGRREAPADRAEGRILGEVPESTKKTPVKKVRGRKKLADQPAEVQENSNIETEDTPVPDVSELDTSDSIPPAENKPVAAQDKE